MKDDERTVNYQFIPTEIAQLGPTILQRLSAFPSMVDGFLVDHIYDSAHYTVMIDDREAGYFSIYNRTLLTQFYLQPEWSRLSQPIFSEVKRMETVQAAFVPTCDGYFLSHALDDYQRLEKQAYFFNYAPQKGKIEIEPRFHCRLAETEAFALIKDQSGDFFSDDALSKHLENREVWLSYFDDLCVGFGLIIPSKLFSDVSDLGMYTIKTHRQQGYGRLTIQYLINVCLSQGLRIAAGCWYYNHASKKTLERAGMYTNTRLLRISF